MHQSRIFNKEDQIYIQSESGFNGDLLSVKSEVMGQVPPSSARIGKMEGHFKTSHMIDTRNPHFDTKVNIHHSGSQSS